MPHVACEGTAAVIADTAGYNVPEPADDPEAAARAAGLALAATFESSRALHMDTARMVARVNAKLADARNMMAELGITEPRRSATPTPS